MALALRIPGSLGRVYYGWWIVIASWLTFLICGGFIFYGFTAFFNPIANEFKWTATQTSVAFSLRSVESSALAPLVGFFLDKIGVRRVVIFGLIVAGLGLIWMSFTNSLAIFYASFMCLAIGVACGISNGQYVIVANWFAKKRSLAMGILSTGYALSGVSGPVLVWLIGNYGWRTTLVILGIIMWAIGIPLSLVLRHHPERYGYLPDGEKPKALAQVKGTSERTTVSKVPERPGMSVRSAMATPAFWLLITFSCLFGFAQASISVHEMPYLTSVGITREVASWVILGITGFSLIGRLSFGWMGDKFDKRYLLAIGAILQCSGLVVFTMVGNPSMIIPFLLLYGPGYASQIPLMPATQVDYFGLKNYATIRGLQSLGWTVAGLISPVLSGWVFDVQGSYRLVWLIYAGLSALAIPVVLMIKKRANVNATTSGAASD